MVVMCGFAREAATARPDTRHTLFQTAAITKKFQLVDSFEQRTPTTPPEKNWKLCLVCQEETAESLVSSVLSKHRYRGNDHMTITVNLVKFDELAGMPMTVQLQILDGE